MKDMVVLRQRYIASALHRLGGKREHIGLDEDSYQPRESFCSMRILS